jgi:hypothetical protein
MNDYNPHTLHSFVNANFKQTRVQPLSSESKRELIRIYKQMSGIHKGLNRLQIREIVSVPYDESNIPSAVKPRVKMCTSNSSYNFNIKHRDVDLYIHAPFVNKSFNRACIKRIYMWLSLASIYACNDCSKKMIIHLYLSDHVKTLPSDDSPIGRNNVNTAFTTACAETTTICIFRREEWFKVLIHETFHNLGLDFSSMSYARADKQITDIFKVRSDVRLFETYCETWAEIIHSQFITFFSTRSHSNYGLMMSKLDDILRSETIFSLFQCAKVLTYNHMSYVDLYSANSAMKRQQYREDSHVLSYYIIKSLLMFHKNAFIEWCSDNNSKFLDFEKTDKNIDRFCDLIRQIHNSPGYVESVLRMGNWFKHNNADTFETSTLRMTIFG